MSRAFLLGTALLGALALGACDAVVGAGDRKLNTTIACTANGACACAVGYGDCDKDPDNGCETDLSSPKNCGACGVTCANGKCESLACVCEGTFGECDGDPKTPCETNLATDSAHCGTCDRDCAGQGCVGGLCKPTPIKGAGGVYSFILVGKKMYFAPLDSMGIASIDVDAGGTPVPFGADMGYAYILYEKDGTLYWCTDTKIFATPLATGQTVEIAANQAPIERLLVAGGKVYWGNFGMADMSLTLRRTGVTPGGMPEDVVKLGDAKYVYDFAVNDDSVFWADIQAIMRSPHDKVMPTLFLNVPKPPTYFEATADTLFFSANPSGVFSVPFKSTDVTSIADVPGYGVLAVDEKNVYWAPYTIGNANPPEIWRAARTGVGAPVKLVSDPFLALGFPIAVDDKWLYWVNTNLMTVVRIPK